MKKLLTLVFLTTIIAMPGKSFVKHIEPSNWWVGMKTPNLQIMIHGQKLQNAQLVGSYKGITLSGIDKTNNENYLFLNLKIDANAKAGAVKIKITSTLNRDTIIVYPILERKKTVLGKKGFSAADAIYLITPDRFANGNPANDSIKGYPDKAKRKDPNGRHGGDIAGIAANIDYIKNLGFTAIWSSPLLENNMPQTSYHGYAITDFYKADPRFGSNEEYFKLVETCHTKGVKVIMDFVLNHCGGAHWWANDLPTSDWYHQFPEFTRTNYRASTLSDIHTSEYDKKIFEKGWFDTSMPDLNQSQPLLANYLIQNAIWWIETANLDGIRLDTQPYSEPEFLYNWGKALTDEYPEFVVVGESWFQHEAFTACYQKNDKPISELKSSIPSVTDFPLCFALNAAVNEKEGWGEGMAKIYNVLAHDFLYADPMHLMIFLDNHDLSRVYESVGDSIKKYKMLVTMLATLRGIPQFYYGAEIMMPGDKAKGDGVIRTDMPGGWAGDSTNAFTGLRLKKKQLEMQEYTKKIFNWRQTSRAICDGKLKHFVPDNGLYVYARYTDSQSVLVLVNNNEKGSLQPEWGKYSEVVGLKTKCYNPISEYTSDLKNIFVPAKTAIILELK